jgi:hypothetical protein
VTPTRLLDVPSFHHPLDPTSTTPDSNPLLLVGDLRLVGDRLVRYLLVRDLRLVGDPQAGSLGPANQKLGNSIYLRIFQQALSA